MYKSYIRPGIDLGDVIMSNTNEQQIQNIESVHKRAEMFISGAIRVTSSETKKTATRTMILITLLVLTF